MKLFLFLGLYFCKNLLHLSGRVLWYKGLVRNFIKDPKSNLKSLVCDRFKLMKITKTIFFACCFVLMTVMSVMAAPTPPQPPQSAARSAATTADDDDDGPPAPPGVPIDQKIFILAGCALIFGIYVIRRYDSIKKASI